MKTNRPNPNRIYAALAQILERRNDVRITYTLKPKN